MTIERISKNPQDIFLHFYIDVYVTYFRNLITSLYIGLFVHTWCEIIIFQLCFFSQDFKPTHLKIKKKMYIV